MRVTKIGVCLLVLLLVASVCMALEGSGSTELTPDPCPDPSELNANRAIPIPFYCQIIDDNEPIGQSEPSSDPVVGTLSLTMRAYKWLSGFDILVPMLRM